MKSIRKDTMVPGECRMYDIFVNKDFNKLVLSDADLVNFDEKIGKCFRLISFKASSDKFRPTAYKSDQHLIIKKDGRTLTYNRSYFLRSSRDPYTGEWTVSFCVLKDAGQRSNPLMWLYECTKAYLQRNSKPIV